MIIENKQQLEPLIEAEKFDIEIEISEDEAVMGSETIEFPFDWNDFLITVDKAEDAQTYSAYGEIDDEVFYDYDSLAETY